MAKRKAPNRNATRKPAPARPSATERAQARREATEQAWRGEPSWVDAVRLGRVEFTTAALAPGDDEQTWLDDVAAQAREALHREALTASARARVREALRDVDPHELDGSTEPLSAAGRSELHGWVVGRRYPVDVVEMGFASIRVGEHVNVLSDGRVVAWLDVELWFDEGSMSVTDARAAAGWSQDDWEMFRLKETDAQDVEYCAGVVRTVLDRLEALLGAPVDAVTQR